MSRFPNSQLARDWKQRIDRFGHCELTIAEFCRIEGCSTASFYQWRRKLRDSSPLEGPAFIAVDHACTMTESHTGGRTEIALPGGAVVKLPGDASLIQQRDLITAILHATASSEVSS